MFAELDVVALTHNIIDYGLSEGSRGTIVQLYKGGDAFAVEFVDNEGYTTVLLDLTSKDVRLVWSKNIHSDIFPSYSAQSSSETKDEEKHWTHKLYSKPDPAGEFTHDFAF